MQQWENLRIHNDLNRHKKLTDSEVSEEDEAAGNVPYELAEQRVYINGQFHSSSRFKLPKIRRSDLMEAIEMTNKSVLLEQAVKSFNECHPTYKDNRYTLRIFLETVVLPGGRDTKSPGTAVASELYPSASKAPTASSSTRRNVDDGKFNS